MSIILEVAAIASAAATIVKVIAPLVRDLLDRSAAKTRELKHNEQYRHASDAVRYAEEWAAGILKLGGNKVVGEKKLEEALDFYMQRMPNEDRQLARTFLRSLLAGTPGAGATGHQVF